MAQLPVASGFLARLAVSRHADTFVVKGGVLLAAYAIRRPTADVDVAARDTPGQLDRIRELVTSIVGEPAEDGIAFDVSTVRAEPIRDEDANTGIRVTLQARLATAVIRFHVDVNVGDPIWPEPEQVRLPRLLEGEITLQGYPLPMVLAEKIVTAAERGTANTRWRDLADDIYLLTGTHTLSASIMSQAIDTVARHRSVPMRPLKEIQAGYAALAQPRWAAWRRKQRLDAVLPEQFGDLLTGIWAFTDPLLSKPRRATWHSATRTWHLGSPD